MARRWGIWARSASSSSKVERRRWPVLMWTMPRIFSVGVGASDEEILIGVRREDRAEDAGCRSSRG
jgi:hypothetical protein